jgi:hypothetical protein
MARQLDLFDEKRGRGPSGAEVIGTGIVVAEIYGESARAVTGRYIVRNGVLVVSAKGFGQKEFELGEYWTFTSEGRHPVGYNEMIKVFSSQAFCRFIEEVMNLPFGVAH